MNVEKIYKYNNKDFKIKNVPFTNVLQMQKHPEVLIL